MQKSDDSVYIPVGVLAVIILTAFPEIYPWFLSLYFLALSILCFFRYRTKIEKSVAYISLLLALGSIIIFYILQ